MQSHVIVQYVHKMWPMVAIFVCMCVCVCMRHAMNYVYKKLENIQKIVTYTIMPKLICVLQYIHCY